MSNEGLEEIRHYNLARRIGYAYRNGWFKSCLFFKLKLPCIPSDQDIHVHNIWKDLKAKNSKKLKKCRVVEKDI